MSRYIKSRIRAARVGQRMDEVIWGSGLGTQVGSLSHCPSAPQCTGRKGWEGECGLLCEHCCLALQHSENMSWPLIIFGLKQAWKPAQDFDFDISRQGLKPAGMCQSTAAPSTKSKWVAHCLPRLQGAQSVCSDTSARTSQHLCSLLTS